jgi:hypothetical protein
MRAFPSQGGEKSGCSILCRHTPRKPPWQGTLKRSYKPYAISLKSIRKNFLYKNKHITFRPAHNPNLAGRKPAPAHQEVGK